MKTPYFSQRNLATVLGFCLFGSPMLAQSQSGPEEGACTNRTLRGDYGFAIEGTIFAIPGILIPGPLPLRAVALTTFDGKGKLTQVDHYVVNGQAPAVEWQASSGTYSVNANCTGKLTLNVPGNPLSPFTLYFVVVKMGQEIRTVANANLVSSVGIKIE